MARRGSKLAATVFARRVFVHSFFFLLRFSIRGGDGNVSDVSWLEQ